MNELIMPQSPLAHERRKEFIPLIAGAFSELGYRRATTAELARRCEVQENILYRLWPDKKAMFIAAIDYVYDLSTQKWETILAADGGRRKTSAAERLLAYESDHHGEFGLYRIIFAGLTETDDAAIRDALRQMYGRYQAFIERRVREHRGNDVGVHAALAAWALVGLGTAASISRDLGLASDADRKNLWSKVGRLLLEG